jgi:hypothetical protein
MGINDYEEYTRQQLGDRLQNLTQKCYDLQLLVTDAPELEPATLILDQPAVIASANPLAISRMGQNMYDQLRKVPRCPTTK